jgi:hypothetical protein
MMTLLLLVFLGPASASALFGGPERWVKVESDNFVFFSNANDKPTVELVKRLERFRHVLGERLRGFTMNAPVPTYVYVFRDDHTFDPYKLRSDTNVSQIVGQFTAHREGNFVALNVEGRPLRERLS